MPKRSLILALVFAVALLAPAGNSDAATLFGGADMSAEPGDLFPPPPASAYVNVENPPGATNNFATVSGVLTSVRMRTQGNAGVGVIRVVRQTGMPNPSTFTFLNVGPEIPITVTADASDEGHITEVLTRRPIEVGDRLSWYTSQVGIQAQHNYQGESATGQCAYLDDGATHLVGTSFDYTDLACNQNVQLHEGTIEPDADGDGYGDETQDLCPTNASTAGACNPPVVEPERTGERAAALRQCKKKAKKKDWSKKRLKKCRASAQKLPL